MKNKIIEKFYNNRCIRLHGNISTSELMKLNIILSDINVQNMNVNDITEITNLIYKKFMFKKLNNYFIDLEPIGRDVRRIKIHKIN